METTSLWRLQLPKVLFWFGITVVVGWIIQLNYFPTYDGPSHLYNSFLLKELLEGDNFLIADHLTLNSWWQSNALGHYLQLAFLAFLPPLIAEKVFVISIVIALSLALNYWIKALKINNKWALVIVLPLLFSDIFFYGFFNFLLGIAGLIVGFGLWFETKDQDFKWSTIGKWLLVFGVTYYSHSAAFGLLILGLFVLEAYRWIAYQKFCIKAFSSWFLPAIIPLIGFIFQLINNSLKGETVWLPLFESLKRVASGHVLIAFNFKEEGPFSIAFAILVLALLGFGIAIHFIEKIDRQKFNGRAVGLLVLLFFILFLVLPNETAGGGFLSDRLLLLFFIFTILWLGIYFQERVWFLAVAGLGGLIIFLGLFRYHRHVYQELNSKIESIKTIATSIPKNAIVLPVFRDANWYTFHHAKYVSILSESVLLNNYEAETGYFPILWNKSQLPNYQIGPIPGSQFECDIWSSNPTNTAQPIPYILWQGEEKNKEKECDINWIAFLNVYYNLIHEEEGWQLFEVKTH